jgi:hypothetical protein
MFNSVKFELSPNRSDWNLCSAAWLDVQNWLDVPVPS